MSDMVDKKGDSKFRNHLAEEKSQYLRMHADNPVDWYPWNNTALKMAVDEDKPIFLSVGYSSCHWCHVMEEEVFRNKDIAEYLNENYVCIKVDREERPDIDNIYMKAVQAMTGSGGWPMSVFLSPDLTPFYGATYIPPVHFIQVIKSLNDAWRSKRNEITSAGERLLELLSRRPSAGDGGVITEQGLKSLIEPFKGYYDSVWGGFQGQMKFPSPPLWEFLLHYYRKTGDEGIGSMVRLTLDRMGSGGIQDHVGGGFHRYSTDPMWLVPHFEKMLYDNSQIAPLYTEAAVVFNSQDYRIIAERTLDFLAREMRGENGEFYSSFDADSGGVEGSFYVWDYDEIIQVAGTDDGQILTELLGVTKNGNFEGKNVITHRADIEALSIESGRSVYELNSLLEKSLRLLYEARSKRVAPSLDRKVITSWNGLAISAFAKASIAFKNKKYADLAEHAADFLFRNHRRDDGGYFRASNNGQVVGDGILDDYGFTANGALDLFMATGDVDYLSWAIDLVNFAHENFTCPDGGYYQTSESSDTPIARQVEFYDGVIPSGNAAMLQAMLKISSFTGDTGLLAHVEKVLGGFSHIAARSGAGFPHFLDATLKFNGPFYDVVIVGEPLGGPYGELFSAWCDVFPCNSVMIRITADGPGETLKKLCQSLDEKVARDGDPTAYVCEFGACSSPTGDPATLKRQLLGHWEH